MSIFKWRFKGNRKLRITLNFTPHTWDYANKPNLYHMYQRYARKPNHLHAFKLIILPLTLLSVDTDLTTQLCEAYVYYDVSSSTTINYKKYIKKSLKQNMYLFFQFIGIWNVHFHSRKYLDTSVINHHLLLFMYVCYICLNVANAIWIIHRNLLFIVS